MSTPTAPLVFGPLPATARTARTAARHGKHTVAAEQLRANPGEWAPVGTYKNTNSAASFASIIRAGRYPDYQPAGAFEAAARTVEGEHRVYARYVGQAGE